MNIPTWEEFKALIAAYNEVNDNDVYADDFGKELLVDGDFKQHCWDKLRATK